MKGMAEGGVGLGKAKTFYIGEYERIAEKY